MNREPKEQLDMDQIDTSMSFSPAHEVGISCGTVTIDLPRGKVLIVWNNRLQIHQLPKGRRNVEETFIQTALRETHEETGYRAKALPLKVPTRAQKPKRALSEKGNGYKKPEILFDRVSTEFIGTCSYPDPQSKSPCFKTVFFWAATCDSTSIPDKDTQDEGENLEAKWIELEDAEKFLRFEAEIAMVKKAVEDIKRSGVDIKE
ncbi:NUDIX hydrolase domain-like protein [Triangularia verruculosa]|uniref:NUDIX hydrolase domain-like protein n=1 Tax=Triangularia verruculosa TaxID=2587418 RepID=A0AAN6XGI4_9PEZI|nr:NUDIX hydrolase domain-like protein [Triangularia verruculosa]